jgi:hypothetical protein
MLQNNEAACGAFFIFAMVTLKKAAFHVSVMAQCISDEPDLILDHQSAPIESIGVN